MCAGVACIPSPAHHTIHTHILSLSLSLPLAITLWVPKLEEEESTKRINGAPPNFWVVAPHWPAPAPGRYREGSRERTCAGAFQQVPLRGAREGSNYGDNMGSEASLVGRSIRHTGSFRSSATGHSDLLRSTSRSLTLALEPTAVI